MKAFMQGKPGVSNIEIRAALPETCLPPCGSSSAARQEERHVCVLLGWWDGWLCLGGMGSLAVNVSSRNNPSCLLGGDGTG